ncbi:hypothetical protein QN354_02210 [Cryobacterium sp. 5I3]|uniref:hypothetical protein n=1 Tax=Cryobacterium sp. 5I3 TaxID=3048592 RepID=UPI002B224F64|nr:hypothetical protein [Cryobacterium sp. 5I3]MEB0200568.1 hypothetical protein [Cryobacterium sp. 5I3]
MFLRAKNTGITKTPIHTSAVDWGFYEPGQLPFIVASEAKLSLIPAAILSTFNVWFRGQEAILKVHGFGGTIGFLQSEVFRYPETTSSLDISGQFNPGTHANPMFAEGFIAATNGVGGETAVHEYGHHIDWTYNRLWPGVDPAVIGNESNNQLSGHPEWRELYGRIQPLINSPVYAKTNRNEWFAECFLYLIVSDAVRLKLACGNSDALVAETRALFHAAMPPMS